MPGQMGKPCQTTKLLSLYPSFFKEKCGFTKKILGVPPSSPCTCKGKWIAWPPARSKTLFWGGRRWESTVSTTSKRAHFFHTASLPAVSLGRLWNDGRETWPLVRHRCPDQQLSIPDRRKESRRNCWRWSSLIRFQLKKEIVWHRWI